MENWTIRIIDKGYKFTRDIYIFRRTTNNKTESITGEIVSAGEEMKPALELEPEQLQALANELNEQGYKPQKGFIEGELEGTKRHLKDLRKMLKLKD